MLGSLVLAVCMLVALGIFGHRVWQLLRLLRLGRGALPGDRIRERMRSVVVNVLGQRSVLRERSGIGHFLIFWGFLILAFGTLEGFIGGFSHGFTFAFLGPVYPVMNSAQDILAFLVLLAIAASVFRRLVLQPVRLEAPKSHKREAFLILGMIAALILCFYGMRAGDPKPGFTPFSDLLAKAAGPLLAPAYLAFEWVHNLLVLGFLAFIPYSKHLHILGAAPNIYFRDETPPGRMAKLDLSDEKAESFGIAKISDYPQKDLLDLYACTECGRCQESCPAYATGKSLSPKAVIQDLKAHLFREGPALLADAKAEPKSKLFPDAVSHESLWACTTCRACEEACPVAIKPMGKLFGIRQNRVLMEGDFPEEAQVALRNMESQSNPWGLPQSDRGKWAEGLGLKTLAEDPSVEYLFYVGCMGSYDDRNVQVTKAVAGLLGKAGVSFGILGSEESCCGDSARRIGNEYLYQALAPQNIDTFNRYGVKKIVTACPHCFNTLKHEYPDFGATFQVLHHSEVLTDLAVQGRLPSTSRQTFEAAYHDSCYLGRYNGNYEAPRKFISAAGGKVKELERNREKSFCCGAGGGRMWMEEKAGKRINEERAREAAAAETKTVCTACPFCLTMMTDGMKSLGKSESVKVQDIAELLWDRVKEDPPRS